MKKEKLYSLMIISLAILSFIYSGYKGNQQVSKRESDYVVYAEIQNSIKTGEKLEESIKKIEKLQNDYNDSYIFNLDKGSIYSRLGEEDKALEELEKAFQKNNGLYKNAGLLIIYAETAQLNGDNKKAQEAISQAQKLGIPQEYQKIADEVLSKIQ